MRRVYVTGNQGLVGKALMPVLIRDGMGDFGNDMPFLDIMKPKQLEQRLEEARRSDAWGGSPAEWVVNLAAWTDVDGCERGAPTPDLPWAANAQGAENVAMVCREVGCRLLQVSTDYVFDGRKGKPYTEEDEPSPLSVYGKSKFDGERRASRVLPESQLLIVRGQSLYGKGRKSFPDAILAAAEAKPEVPVVTDQTVQPTWVHDFAEALVALMLKDARGVVHFAASGSCTWHEFARAVLEEAGRDPTKITETTAAALARPAPRPAYSVFDLGKFERLTGVRPRPWREQLRGYLGSTRRAA